MVVLQKHKTLNSKQAMMGNLLFKVLNEKRLTPYNTGACNEHIGCQHRISTILWTRKLRIEIPKSTR